MKNSRWIAIHVTACVCCFALLGAVRSNVQGGQPESANPQAILFFDFEDSQTCDDGWSFELDEAHRVWHCGQVNTGPRGGVFNSRGALFASTLGSPGPLAGMVVSPEIQLPVGSSYLALESWNDFDAAEVGTSGGRILVFLGDRSHPLRPLAGYADPKNKFSVSDRAAQRYWRRLVFDLTKYGGNTIRLGFEADGQLTPPGHGWFIDDILIALGQPDDMVSRPRDYRLRDCQPGQVLRFDFSQCLDDWQAESSGSSPVWHCAPPSLDPDPTVPPSPPSDSPAYFKDGSGRLIATEPGGTYPAGVIATMTSPMIDLARCPGCTFLSFWHWYHFAPSDGGYVELWNGQKWIPLNPIDGYPGEITGTSLGKALEGYVSAQDMPSGWRRAIFNLTPHLSAKHAQKIKVRFVSASAPNRARRPGWYLDTIEIGRSLEFFEGAFDCKLPAVDLSQLDPAPGLPKDPCREGRLVAPSRVVVGASEKSGDSSDNPNPANEPVVFLAQNPGWLCVEIHRGTADGSLLAEGMSLLSDGQQIDVAVSADGLAYVLVRAPLPAGWHSVQLLVERGVATYRVFFAEHATGPIIVPSLLNQTPKLRLQNLRPLGAQDAQGSRSRIVGEFSIPYPQAVPGLGELTAPYQLRLIRADTCQEVLRVTGAAPFDAGSHVGTGERIAAFACDWNRLDFGGAFVPWDVPLFLFLQFAAIELLDGPPPVPEEDLLGPAAVLPGEALAEIQEAVSVYIPARHWFFDFDWTNPRLSNPSHDSTYSNEVALGGEISFGDSGFATVFPSSGPRVDLFLTQAGMMLPVMPTRFPATGRTRYFDIRIPVSMNPGPAAFHLTHNVTDVRGSPAALSVLAPEVISVIDSSVCAGDTVRLTVRNFTSALIDSGQITGELVGTASAPVEGIFGVRGVVGTEVNALDVQLPASAAFAPGRYRLLIRRNGATVTGGDRGITLCDPEPDLDRIERLTDASDRSDWMRPGDRIRLEGENLWVPAYGDSLLRLRREDTTTIDVPATAIDPNVLEVNLPATLPLGRYEASVAFAGTTAVETDSERLEVRSRMDGDFTLIRMHEFTTPRDGSTEECTDASGRRWTLRTRSVRTPTGPDEFAYTILDGTGRAVTGGSDRFTVGPGRLGGVKLTGNCRLLLVIDRADDDAVAGTPPPWNFSAWYYSAARERFETVGSLRITLPDSTCCINNGFYLVSPDGSVVVQGLWQAFDTRTTFGIHDVSSDSSLCTLVPGFCLPFDCPLCGLGMWRARITGNELDLLEITGGIIRNWVPERTRGPVALPRGGDPDGP
ncbi:MAG: hypothetical protein L0Z50_16375 [Verrucomicrobiales bacterium]|nr:hypothetical protein [Verrucomicrobiales bacterium]